LSDAETSFAVGDRITFWTGRGSHGQATIRELRNGRAFLDPTTDAVRGSDYRKFRQPAARVDVWAPRDYGVRLDQLNTTPQPWWRDL
jgi:hypothetical protein